MYEITREIDFCYGHRILNHSGKCGHLHGHNGRVVVTFASLQLDELDMVVDFFEVKNRLGGWINENLDHRMILHRDDPAVQSLKALGEPLFLMDASPTAEMLAKLIFEVAEEHGLPIQQVELWESRLCCARFAKKEK